MKTIEEWKVIEDFPEYEVSSFGRIKRSNKFLTPTYNNIYGTKTLRQANAISKKVLVIDKDNNVKKYNSLDDVAIALNCCKSNVSRVIDRPTKRCKGYKIISDIIYK